MVELNDRPISATRSGGLVALGVGPGALCGAAALGLLARFMRADDFVSLAALTPVVGVVSAVGRFGFDRLAIRQFWLAPAGQRASTVLRYLVAGIVATAGLATVLLLVSRAIPGGWQVPGHLSTGGAVLVLIWCVGESARYGAADLPRSWGRDLTATLVGHGGRNLGWLVAVGVAGLAGDVSLTVGIATVAVPSLLVGCVGMLQVAARARAERGDGSRADPVRIDHRVVRSGLTLAALLVAGIVIAQFDVVVVSGRFPSQTAANYAVAARVATTFGLSLVVLTGLLPSLLGRLGLIGPGALDADRRTVLSDVMALVTTVATAASAAAMAVFVAVGTPLLDHGLGPEFRGAYGLTLVLLVGQAINVLTGATGTMLILVHEEAHLVRIGVVAAAIALGAELIAARHGIYWVAWTSTAAVALPNVLYARRVRRVLGFAPLPTMRRARLAAGLAHLRTDD